MRLKPYKPNTIKPYNSEKCVSRLSRAPHGSCDHQASQPGDVKQQTRRQGNVSPKILKQVACDIQPLKAVQPVEQYNHLSSTVIASNHPSPHHKVVPILNGTTSPRHHTHTSPQRHPHSARHGVPFGRQLEQYPLAVGQGRPGGQSRSGDGEELKKGGGGRTHVHTRMYGVGV